MGRHAEPADKERPRAPAVSILSLSVAVLLAAAAPTWTQQGPSPEQETTRYVEFLKTQNIEATTEALRKYLQGLYPSEAHKKRVGELIRQLGSPRWVDQLAALGRVFLRQESLERDVGGRRIGVVLAQIGIGELLGLDRQVQ